MAGHAKRLPGVVVRQRQPRRKKSKTLAEVFAAEDAAKPHDKDKIPPWYDPERMAMLEQCIANDMSRAPKSIIAKGKALLKTMRGKGWKLRIWDNLGWHYCVFNGPLSVYTNERDGEAVTYHCFTSRKSVLGGGECFWTDNEVFTDPNEAVQHQLKLVREFTDACIAVQDHIESLQEDDRG